MLAWVSIGSAAMAADGAVGYTLIADYTNPTGTTLAGGTATAGTAGTAGANFTGAYVSDDNDGSAGGIGAAGGTGVSSTGSTGFTLTNQGTINGGAGGMGGTGGAGGFADAYPYNHGGAGGAGGQGGSGGAGVSGTGFTLSNTGTIVGGSAGAGGTGGAGGSASYADGFTGGNGGNAGIAGAGVSGSGFTLFNSGTITGGSGGAAGSGGVGGSHFSSAWYSSYGAAGDAGASSSQAAAVISTGSSTIYNSGTITGGTTAISLSGGANTLVLMANSVINGNVVSTSGTTLGGDTLTLGGDTNAVGGNSFSLASVGTSAQYRGFNNFSKAGTSTWSLTGTGTSDWTVNAGTLSLAHGVALTGGVTVSGGTLALPAGATATVSTYTQQSSGTFQTSLTSSTDIGKLVVSGTATLPSAANITVNVDSSTTDYGFTSSSLRNIISAGTLVSDGTFTVTDNSTLFNFSAEKSGNSVNLTYVLASGGSSSLTVSGYSNHQTAGVATALDSIFTSAPMGTMANLFVSLTTQQQVSNALAQTLPLLSGSTTVVSADALGKIHHIIDTRLKGETGGSADDAEMANSNLWFKPFGGKAVQNDYGTVSGYAARTGGLVLGLDKAVSPAWRLGGALAYAQSSLDGNSLVAAQSATVDMYQVVGYGDYKVDDRTLLALQASVGKNSTKGERVLAFASSTAASSYDSQTAHLGASLGRQYALNGQTVVTPTLQADYTWIKDKAYSETGAGDLNLQVKGRIARSLVLGMDTQMAHHLDARTAFTWHAGWGYDTLNAQSSMAASFAGAPQTSFSTPGMEQSPWMLKLGMGWNHQTLTGMALQVRYDSELRRRFNNQTASVKLNWAY